MFGDLPLCRAAQTDFSRQTDARYRCDHEGIAATKRRTFSLLRNRTFEAVVIQEAVRTIG